MRTFFEGGPAMPVRGKQRARAHGGKSAGAATRRRRWSRGVTERSAALDLESRGFTRSPKEIARSLKRSAEHNSPRKSPAFKSPRPLSTFSENRDKAGAS